MTVVDTGYVSTVTWVFGPQQSVPESHGEPVSSVEVKLTTNFLLGSALL